MNATAKAVIALLVCFAVAGVIVVKQNQRTDTPSASAGGAGGSGATAPVRPADTPAVASKGATAESDTVESGAAPRRPDSADARLPKLLDLGSTSCIPCQKMEPILAELKRDYGGKLDVEFIDIYADEASAAKYGVDVIPTQIFFGADGKELYRHIGFYAKEEILAKWAELGVELKPER